MRLAIFLTIVAILHLFGGAKVYGQDAPMVHLAGFALAGNFGDNQRNYPYTSELIALQAQGDVPLVNQKLVSRLTSRRFSNFTLTTDLGDYKKGDGLALGCVLTWENVSTERFGDVTKLTVDLHAEALLFNFSSMQVVSAYPFAIQYIDAVNGNPTHEQIATIIRKLYLEDGSGLFDQFAETLSRVHPKTSYGARIQVMEASIEPAALEKLAGIQLPGDQARALLTSSFERFLSKNAGIPILPHAPDQAIQGAMAARFANGDIYNLKIPPADYQIRLDLAGLRKIQVDQTSAEIAWAYASYLHVSLEQPLSGARLLAVSFKYPVVKVVAAGGVLPDDRSNFQESLFSISDQITAQMSSPDSSWIEKWAVTDGAADQLRSVGQVLARCR